METQYLNLLKDVLENGSSSDDRTGVGTIRSFGKSMEFDLSDSFPLLTTKKMAWKSIIHELLWFLSGDTNLKYLKENNVKIWDANAEDFKKRRTEHGIYTAEGECGYIYGHQWRNFVGSKNSEPVDQIKNICEELKINPTSRRLLVSAWNPSQIDPLDSCLPPCHVLFQLFVDNGELSCSLYQRSGDCFLGVPFNIASYSFLTYMFADIFDLKPKKFVHFIGDCHIYNNHIEQVKEQLSRTPYDFPKLKIINTPKDIFSFNIDNFVIEDYKYHPAIKADMAV